MTTVDLSNAHPGDIVRLNENDLLVLDTTDQTLFVIALNIEKTSLFGNSNNYDGSTLEEEVNKWVRDNKFDNIIKRTIDLTTLDGGKKYGKKEVCAAPLTLDEYRKYAPIIFPHIKQWFWLATGWASLSRDEPKCCCYIDTLGRVMCRHQWYDTAIAPAFILSKHCPLYLQGILDIKNY